MRARESSLAPSVSKRCVTEHVLQQELKKSKTVILCAGECMTTKLYVH